MGGGGNLPCFWVRMCGWSPRTPPHSYTRPSEKHDPFIYFPYRKLTPFIYYFWNLTPFIYYFSNFTHSYTFWVKKIPHWYTFDVKMIQQQSCGTASLNTLGKPVILTILSLYWTTGMGITANAACASKSINYFHQRSSESKCGRMACRLDFELLSLN